MPVADSGRVTDADAVGLRIAASAWCKRGALRPQLQRCASGLRVRFLRAVTLMDDND